MCVELKIKAKHLALEPAIIRMEERKLVKRISFGTNASKLDSLVWHRCNPVRNESRATTLARAYLAGKAYRKVEQIRKPDNEYKFINLVLPRVLAMVRKYGRTKELRDTTLDQLKEWSK